MLKEEPALKLGKRALRKFREQKNELHEQKQQQEQLQQELQQQQMESPSNIDKIEDNDAENEGNEENADFESEETEIPSTPLTGTPYRPSVSREEEAATFNRQNLQIWRTITSFDITTTPLTIHNKQWVSFSIKGNSFLLHQIRMMIGMILGIVKGHIPPFTLYIALTGRFSFRVPLVPGDFLVLKDNNFLDGKFREYSLFNPEVVKQPIEDFKNKVLIPHLAALHDTEKVRDEWQQFF